MPNFVEIARTMAEIWRFFILQDGGRSHLLDCLNFKFVTVRAVKSVELRHRAIFCGNRSNRGWGMAIFRIFQDGSRPPSWICDVCVGTTHKGHLVVFSTVQNLVGIDAVVLIIWTFFDFFEFGLKMSIHAQKLGYLGVWPPKWGAMWTNPQKHILARVCVVWAVMRENPSTGLTCRWIPKKKEINK